MFDYSKEEDNVYLIELLRSIISSNYYNNLKSIKVYKDKIENNLSDKKLPTSPDYEINEDQNHSHLGLIFHTVNIGEKNKFDLQVYAINKIQS